MDASGDVTLQLRARRNGAPARAPEEAARTYAARALRRWDLRGGTERMAPRAWLLDSVDTLHELDLAPLPDMGLPLLLDALEQVFDRVRARRVALLLPSRDGGPTPLVLLTSDGFETELRGLALRGRTVVSAPPPPLATARFERLVRGESLRS